MKKAIATEKAPAAIGPYSQGVEFCQLIFTSGQLPIDPATGEMPESIEDCTRQALTNLQAVLEEAGSDLSKVLKTTVFLRDMDDFAAMNGVYAEFFAGSAFPARSAVQVAKLPKGARVEIEAVAHK